MSDRKILTIKNNNLFLKKEVFEDDSDRFKIKHDGSLCLNKVTEIEGGIFSFSENLQCNSLTEKNSYTHSQNLKKGTLSNWDSDFKRATIKPGQTIATRTSDPLSLHYYVTTGSNINWEEVKGSYSVTSFNGVSDWVSIPSISALNAQTFTMSCWVLQRSRVGYGTIMGKWHDATDNRQYQIAIRETGEVRFDMSDTGEWDNKYMMHESTTEFPLNKLILVTATYDGYYKRLYFDTNEVMSFPLSIEVHTSNTQAYIGGYTSTPYERYNDAIIFDARFYNRAISRDEVFLLYNGIPVTNGLISHYPLNEASGAVAYDLVSGNNGTIHGTSKISYSTSITNKLSISNDKGSTWDSWKTITNNSSISPLPKDTHETQVKINTTLSTTDSRFNNFSPQFKNLKIEIDGDITNDI